MHRESYRDVEEQVFPYFRTLASHRLWHLFLIPIGNK